MLEYRANCAAEVTEGGFFPIRRMEQEGRKRKRSSGEEGSRYGVVPIPDKWGEVVHDGGGIGLGLRIMESANLQRGADPNAALIIDPKVGPVDEAALRSSTMKKSEYIRRWGDVVCHEAFSAMDSAFKACLLEIESKGLCERRQASNDVWYPPGSAPGAFGSLNISRLVRYGSGKVQNFEFGRQGAGYIFRRCYPRERKSEAAAKNDEASRRRAEEQARRLEENYGILLEAGESLEPDVDDQSGEDEHGIPQPKYLERLELRVDGFLDFSRERRQDYLQDCKALPDMTMALVVPLWRSGTSRYGFKRWSRMEELLKRAFLVKIREIRNPSGGFLQVLVSSKKDGDILRDSLFPAENFVMRVFILCNTKSFETRLMTLSHAIPSSQKPMNPMTSTFLEGMGEDEEVVDRARTIPDVSCHQGGVEQVEATTLYSTGTNGDEVPGAEGDVHPELEQSLGVEMVDQVVRAEEPSDGKGALSVTWSSLTNNVSRWRKIMTFVWICSLMHREILSMR